MGLSLLLPVSQFSLRMTPTHDIYTTAFLFLGAPQESPSAHTWEDWSSGGRRGCSHHRQGDLSQPSATREQSSQQADESSHSLLDNSWVLGGRDLPQPCTPPAQVLASMTDMAGISHYDAQLVRHLEEGVEEKPVTGFPEFILRHINLFLPFKVKSSHLHISPLAVAGWQTVGRGVEMGGGYNFPGS